MASSEGNYHRRGPYFDGTNFVSWKHKMKMHVLGHNPAVWAIVCIDLLGGDDLLVGNSSYENYDELAINHDNQDKTNDDDKKEIERITKELNTQLMKHSRRS